MRVALYIRVATREQIDCDLQRDSLRDFISEHKDWNAVSEYFDYTKARPIWERPGLKLLLEEAKAGKFDKVVAGSASRLARSSGDLFKLEEKLRGLGVSLETMQEGPIRVSPIFRKGGRKCP